MLCGSENGDLHASGSLIIIVRLKDYSKHWRIDLLKLIRITLYVFLGIVAATTTIVLAGLCYLWFFNDTQSKSDLPHLKYLLIALIAEVIGVVMMIARKGAKYLPHIECHKKESETLKFMKDFVVSGSTAQIVSSRLSWIKNSQELVVAITNKADEGSLVEVITPQPVEIDIRSPLENAGVRFFTTGENLPPNARFTLINGNRSGAERLAIARGSHPEHEVTVFDNNSGPQIIGMAKDIIRKSKELANARKLG